MVLIDAVNEGINEGCDLHEDHKDGGVNWYSGWDVTLAPSNDNTYAATGNDIGSGSVCFDFCSTNVVQLSMSSKVA